MSTRDMSYMVLVATALMRLSTAAAFNASLILHGFYVRS
jgi:hypothetical protein